MYPKTVLRCRNCARYHRKYCYKKANEFKNPGDAIKQVSLWRVACDFWEPRTEQIAKNLKLARIRAANRTVIGFYVSAAGSRLFQEDLIKEMKEVMDLLSELEGEQRELGAKD